MRDSASFAIARRLFTLDRVVVLLVAFLAVGALLRRSGAAVSPFPPKGPQAATHGVAALTTDPNPATVQGAEDARVTL